MAVDVQEFVRAQADELREEVGDSVAINALSGGVDSSVVTVIGHRALGDRLKTVFVDNALMREGEPEHIVGLFRGMGIPVELVDAREEFARLKKSATLGLPGSAPVPLRCLAAALGLRSA